MTVNFWQRKKVRLRDFEPSDADYFYRWDLNSERARHLDFVWPPGSKAGAQSWVEKMCQQKMENDTLHLIIENLTGEPVGSINTHHYIIVNVANIPEDFS